MDHYPGGVVLEVDAVTIECVCGWAVRIVHGPDCDCGAPDLLDVAIAAGEAHVRVEGLRLRYAAN